MRSRDLSANHFMTKSAVDWLADTVIKCIIATPFLLGDALDLSIPEELIHLRHRRHTKPVDPEDIGSSRIVHEWLSRGAHDQTRR